MDIIKTKKTKCGYPFLSFFVTLYAEKHRRIKEMLSECYYGVGGSLIQWEGETGVLQGWRAGNN
ncbi:hypothetical protein EBB54_04595 [Schaedlerella arabinosiphila]|jgi:hypothetical protein|uniref:Uncharacterized protein n=1 Tax=Schaedlerella arabinosiphila TaxID=2044587 RepID=A0A3R8JK25_9FIRM|nr:hypothetical protein EBB54_04595 [Schaedlerella arabinosiphila]